MKTIKDVNFGSKFVNSKDGRVGIKLDYDTSDMRSDEVGMYQAVAYQDNAQNISWISNSEKVY